MVVILNDDELCLSSDVAGGTVWENDRGAKGGAKREKKKMQIGFNMHSNKMFRSAFVLTNHRFFRTLKAKGVCTTRSF